MTLTFFSYQNVCMFFFRSTLETFWKALEIHIDYTIPKDIHSGFQSCMHYCLNETQTKLKKMKRRKKSSSNKTTKWKLESSHSSHLRSRFVISCSEFKTAQAKMNQSHSQSKRRKRGKPSGEHRIKNKSTREKKINIQNRSWIDDEERNFKRKSTICTIHKWIVIWLCSDWCRLSTTLCIFTMNCYQTKMKFKIIIKKK